MGEKNCGHCVFYRDEGEEPPWGYCERFPPVYIVRPHPHVGRDPESSFPEQDGYNWAQPITGPGARCGEFRSITGETW